jgi:hypothetical protein
MPSRVVVMICPCANMALALELNVHTRVLFATSGLHFGLSTCNMAGWLSTNRLARPIALTPSSFVYASLRIQMCFQTLAKNAVKVKNAVCIKPKYL